MFLGQCRKILLDQSVSFHHLVPALVRISKKLSKNKWIRRLKTRLSANREQSESRSDCSGWKSLKSTWRLACEQQTYFRRERSDDRKCVRCSQANGRPDVSVNHKVQQHFLNPSMRHGRNQQIGSYSTSLRSIVPSVYSKCLLWRLEQKISLGSLRNQLSVAARQ